MKIQLKNTKSRPTLTKRKPQMVAKRLMPKRTKKMEMRRPHY